MKKLNLTTLLIVLLGMNIFAFAAENKSNLKFPMVANNCPKGCNSCWDQCTKNDDCGVGYKCVRGACGTRCVSET